MNLIALALRLGLSEDLEEERAEPLPDFFVLVPMVKFLGFDFDGCVGVGVGGWWMWRLLLLVVGCCVLEGGGEVSVLCL